MSALITPELVTLDKNLGSSRADVIRSLAQAVADSGRASEFDGLYADAMAREEKTATGVPGGPPMKAAVRPAAAPAPPSPQQHRRSAPLRCCTKEPSSAASRPIRAGDRYQSAPAMADAKNGNRPWRLGLNK